MFVEYDSCVILLRLVKHVLVYVSGTENAEFQNAASGFAFSLINSFCCFESATTLSFSELHHSLNEHRLKDLDCMNII